MISENKINRFVCRIPTFDEILKKWDYEIENADDKNNRKVWKDEFIEYYKNGRAIPYYGFLGDEIICEATAFISKNWVTNPDGLVDEFTAYLCAFRTVKEYQGHGCFSTLFKYMVDDLKNRWYKNLTVGVEPQSMINKEIYSHYGFNELVKTDLERNSDWSLVTVEYYKKYL